MASYPHTDFIPGLPPALLIPLPKKAASVSASPKTKKKLIRRTDREYSQPLRRAFQIAFLVMNVWLGGTFYLWVRQFEPGGQPSSLSRPAGVEGWLPIAGMMNLKYLVLTHQVPALHPAALFLLVTFASIAFLFRKAFCSWLCPVGTISEYLWQLGKKIFRRNFRINRWVDIPLRGLKYLLLGFFVWAVSSMTPPDIVAFMRSPYGVIADVKMLNFFRSLGITGAIVLGILVIASILVQNFWCRYLCPYGALLGLTSFFSPVRIRRDENACIDCAKCAKACPSALPVDKLITIKSAECTGCLECVAVCPAQGALQMSLPTFAFKPASIEQPAPTPVRQTPRAVPAWAMATGIAVLFFGIIGFAKTAGYWTSDVPRSVYEQIVPHANEARHPMPGD
jgi:polyferredoxin